MSRRADHRAALVGLVAVALAVVLAVPAHAAPVAPGSEMWGAELALDGGDDSNLALTDGAVRLAGAGAAGAAGTPAVGVLMLAPRRTSGPTDTVAATLTADRPPGTTITTDVRGVGDDGRWGPWVGVGEQGDARLPTPTTEIGVRLTLHGRPGADGPVVRGLWLTSSRTTPPATPAALFDADIPGRGLDGFEQNEADVTEPASVTLVPGPPRAIRFSVPAGAQRAEIEPQVPDLIEGQQRFFRLTYTLPPEFPVDAQDFQLVTQWKNAGEGSPPVELRIGNGRLALSGGFGRPGGSRAFTTDVGAVTGGRTIDLVVGILFSEDPAKGSVDVWLDGTHRVADYRPAGGTLYPGLPSYWKVGLYRATGLPTTATADLTVARAGTTYESVTAAGTGRTVRN